MLKVSDTAAYGKFRKAIRLARLHTTGKAIVHSMVMRLDAHEYIQRTMAKGSYEPEQTAWTKECLSTGDRFVDLGANFGWYTTLASTIVGPGGSVFAFEPSPVAADVIEHTVAENRLTNVTLVRSAVGDSVGCMTLYMPVNEHVHSPSGFFSDPAFVPLEVPLTSLDDFKLLADGRRIKLIKIDVEGSEPNVMRGMRELVRQGMVENIFCEFNSGWLKRNGTESSGLFELITSYGFSVHRKTRFGGGPDHTGGTFECQDICFKWQA